MTVIDWIVLLVAVQRLAEPVYAGRNRKLLLADGGVEHGAAHYPLFVVLHGTWLAAIWLLADPQRPVDAFMLSAFVLLQALRIWIVVTLGRFWTTRIITVPNAPLIRKGPYRWLRHPNYVVVILEITVLPAVFGLAWVTIVFSLLNGLLLFHRIRVEDEVLKPRRENALAGR